ncbi:uncharacterized protein L969DRAFT_85270 [Mixia osmundae IAM 14324]|nr:uncharacterized protein L969DRAFT_85270 [Mixia osmundae IAM 14324]KEI41491.1 hypothetical protein L969DRAFT_85270 [Mixia osmundae IAM 14324]
MPAKHEVVDFSSNDYLSLGSSQRLQETLISSLRSASCYGPASSRLLDGNTSAHRQLEQRLCDTFNGKSALLFNSGYDANASLWSVLPCADDYVLYDEYVHASTHDGLRLSRCPKSQRQPFQHNSVLHLRQSLQSILATSDKVRTGQADVFVAVESLYSMDGDLAPLPDLLAAIEQELPLRNAHLMVDEAHTTGLYGPGGRGLVCHYGLAARVPLRLHTFGKSLASNGAVLLCSPTLRRYLVNYARPLIYSSTLSHFAIKAIDAALTEMLAASAARQHVLELSARARRQLTRLLEQPAHAERRLHLMPLCSADHLQCSPIIPILSSQPRMLAVFLQAKGLLLRPIAYPTVPIGTERVRLCIHARNTQAQVDLLLSALQEWLEMSPSSTPQLLSPQNSTMREAHL